MSCLVQVINLKRATDRLEHFDAQAKAQGFAYRRFEAIEGSEPGVQELTRGIKLSLRTEPLRSNEVALGLSHRACWRNLLDSPFESTIVFEDDVVLAPGFMTVLQDGWIPKDADIVKLETFPPQATKVSRRIAATVGGRNLNRLQDDHVCAAAYLVTRKGAKRLLDAVDDFSLPIDMILFWTVAPLFHQCKIYQMVPAPCIQGMYLSPESEWTKSSVQVPTGAAAECGRRTQVECQGTTEKSAIDRINRRVAWRTRRNRLYRCFMRCQKRASVPFA